MEQLSQFFDWIKNFFSSTPGMIIGGIVGVIAILVIWVHFYDKWRWNTKGNTRANEKFSQDDDVARALALGYIQLVNSFCAWNDPTGSQLSKEGLKQLRNT